MRKRTLAAVCSILSIVILLALSLSGIRIPLGLFPFIVFLVLVPLLMVPLTLLNKRLLAWRKARGRDIEEEEKYEIEDTDFISLRRRPDRQSEANEENKHLPILFR